MPSLTKEEAERQAEFKYNGETRRFGLGTGVIEVVKDDKGNEFLFKPAQSKRGVEAPYRAYIQQAASRLQGLINPTSRVDVKLAMVNDKFGAIQPYVRSLTISKKGLDNLTKEQVEELLGEYVVDYLLCNFDSHAENYLIDRQGHVRGVDKEQSFRYLDETKSNDLRMLTNFNQMYQEEPPIYGKFLGYLESEFYGDIDVMDILGKYMDRLARISDQEYVALFEKYADDRASGDNIKKSEILSRILLRRTKMLINFNRSLVNQRVYEDQGKKYNIFKDKETFGRNREHEFELKEDSIIRYTNDNVSKYDSQASKLLDSDTLFSVIKTQDGITRVLITPQDGQNILLSFESNEEMIGKLEQLALNIANVRTSGKPLVITTESSRKTMFKPGPENSKKGSYSAKFYEIFNELCALYKVDKFDVSAIMNRVTEKKYNYLTVDECKEIFENPYSNKSYLRRYKRFEELEKQTEQSEENIELEHEKERVIKKFLVELGRDKTYIISSPDELIVNGEKMLPSRQAARQLLTRAIRYDENGEYIDLCRKFYFDSIKDLLIREMLGRTYEFTKEQKDALVTYKGAGFIPFNAFTRGNFSAFEAADDNFHGQFRIDEIVDNLFRLEAIAKALPDREYSLLISRLGSGKTKQDEVGSRNDYDSMVSFGVNEGSAFGTFGNSEVRYQRVLKRDEPALPIELFTKDSFQRNPTECEILTMPFSYSVGKLIRGIGSSRLIGMQECREIDLSLLLERRTEELIQTEEARIEQYKKSREVVKSFGSKAEKEEFRNLGLEREPYTRQKTEEELKAALEKHNFDTGSFFSEEKQIRAVEGDDDSSLPARKYSFLKKLAVEEGGQRDYSRQILEALNLLKKVGPERRNVSAEEMIKKYALLKNKEYVARVVALAIADDREALESKDEYSTQTAKAIVPIIADFIKLYSISEGTYESEIREEDFETEFGRSMIIPSLRLVSNFEDIVNVLGIDVKRAEELIKEAKKAREIINKAKEHPYVENLKSKKLAYYDEERAKEILLQRESQKAKPVIPKDQIVGMSRSRNSDKILDAVNHAKELIKSKLSKDKFRG